jgi:hypothetical protein
MVRRVELGGPGCWRRVFVAAPRTSEPELLSRPGGLTAWRRVCCRRCRRHAVVFFGRREMEGSKTWMAAFWASIAGACVCVWMCVGGGVLQPRHQAQRALFVKWLSSLSPRTPTRPRPHVCRQHRVICDRQPPGSRPVCANTGVAVSQAGRSTPFDSTSPSETSSSSLPVSVLPLVPPSPNRFGSQSLQSSTGTSWRSTPATARRRRSEVAGAGRA